MHLKLRYILIILIPIVFSTSCKYQKLLKSTDNKTKYEVAKEYYENEDYVKAMTLFEQLKPIYRGTEKGEEVSYYFAYCNYYTKNYILAGHYFRQFIGAFPNSQFAEECTFMNAYCYYLDSPKSTLAQESTYKALDEVQLYLGRYPDNDRMEECNELIDDLTRKLQKKAYDNAFLYYKVGQFKAASVALKSSLELYPDSEYREQTLYYIIKSDYTYALNSVYGKTTDRLKEALKDYKIFVKAFPESKYLKDLTKIHEDITKKLAFLN